MGRKRRGNEWLPQRVYLGKSAYGYRPKGGGCVRLLPLSAKPEAVIRRYDEEKAKFEMVSGTFAQLCTEFFESSSFSNLSKRTQSDYFGNHRMVKPVFGKMRASAIKPEHVRQYMDRRGLVAEVRANREHSFMSKVFSWAYERGKVSLNPCQKVRRFSEKPRDRYITDEEYGAVYAAARPTLKALMEISYCCAARQGDVLSMKRSQLKEDGIYICQGKTNKAQIKKWSDRLREAVDLAFSSQPIRHVDALFVSKGGSKVTTYMVRGWWDKAKADAKEINPSMGIDFTFHDIKAKSISDYDGNKQKFSGHKTLSQVAIYDRRTELVDTHE